MEFKLDAGGRTCYLNDYTGRFEPHHLTQFQKGACIQSALGKNLMLNCRIGLPSRQRN